jgi:hypothetical protein
MTAILCDICRKELEPRGDGHYGWFSKGGVVVLVGTPERARPARLQHDGKDVNECCSECVSKTYARAWVRNGEVM